VFKITLSQFNNVHDLDAEKRKREKPKDELYLKIDTENGRAEFQKPKEKPAQPKPQE
jgi:hypothetical protein